MKKHFEVAAVLLFVGFAVLGCSVTEEKITLWKSTQNGPGKIADVIRDQSQEISLRSAATVALIDLKEHALINDVFRGLPPDDADEVILASMPALTRQIKGDSAEDSGLSSTQITAKDGMYLLFAFAGQKSRKPVEDELIRWCTEGDFRAREQAGFNIRVIIEKIGVPVYRKMIKNLTIDKRNLMQIARILRASENREILNDASRQLAGELQRHLDKITDGHLTAAAIIGGKPVADMLVAVVAQTSLPIQLRNYALLAYSTALEKKNVSSNDKQVARLVSAAEDTARPTDHREQIYLTLAQTVSPATVASFKRLLKDQTFFWRMVGVRCLLRQNGEAHLDIILENREMVTDTQETEELTALIARFPNLKSAIVAKLKSNDRFSMGLAIGVLALLGTQDDIPSLKPLTRSRERLPAEFPDKTVGAAASAAILAIEKKG
ncbi:MAG: hypothetical protein JXR76_32085 [Deltaproteobacteria bacterium]|nr:hypothetical protein [Deltaproteobacteria bacterium]